MAVMSYEKYYAENVRNIVEYAFVQSDIRKRAEEINGAPVEAARTSQWVCGDHENHTYSYLRAVGELDEAKNKILPEKGRIFQYMLTIIYILSVFYLFYHQL